MAKLLPYGRQSIDDDDIQSVVDALRGDWLTQGPTVAAFEERVAEYLGAKYAVAVASGTAALHLACLAAGVKPGDTGVTSDITFVASANAIRYCGGRPRLADVAPDTGLVRPESMATIAVELANRGTAPRVLIPVDFAGSVAALPSIRAVADAHGAMVIEDAAHSLGATYEHEGQTFRAGSCAHAHFAITSFHPVKHVTTAEGGAITTNDEGAYRELLELRSHGITKDPSRLRNQEGPWYYEQRSLGFHYRITDLQCALGISQMRKAAAFVARRRELVASYRAALGELSEHVVPLATPSYTTSSYHLFVVRLVRRAGESLTDVAARRRRLYDHLRANDILPQVHYIPVHRQPNFVDEGLSEGSFEGAEEYYAGCLSLPLFPAMLDEDVVRVVAVLGEALNA